MTERPQRTFELYIPIAKRDEDKRLVFGWMYKSTDENGRILVDKHDDFMLPEDLEEAAYTYVDSSRVGGVMHLRNKHLAGVSKGERGAVVIDSKDAPYAAASLVESMVFTPEKCEALGIAKSAIPNGAWWVGYRVNDDRVWGAVKDGRLKGFSIHGAAMRAKVDDVEKLAPVGKSETAVQQQVTPVTPSTPTTQTTVTAGPSGKTTRKTKKTVRPQRPQGMNKLMDAVSSSKGAGESVSSEKG